jgi:hypothetical protein
MARIVKAGGAIARRRPAAGAMLGLWIHSEDITLNSRSAMTQGLKQHPFARSLDPDVMCIPRPEEKAKGQSEDWPFA